MEREIMELYCGYEGLIYKDIQGMSLQELLDLRFEILRLRNVIMPCWKQFFQCPLILLTIYPC